MHQCVCLFVSLLIVLYNNLFQIYIMSHKTKRVCDKFTISYIISYWGFLFGKYLWGYDHEN